MAAAAESPFTVTTLESPMRGTQVVLPGDFRDTGKADVFIITVGAEGARRGRLFEQRTDGTYDPEPVRDLELDRSAIVVDVGRIGGRDVVVWIGQRGVIQFDPMTDTVQRIARGKSIYAVPMKADLKTVDFLRDVTDDGLDDLVIPTFDGYRIHVQRKDGSFAPATFMAAPAVMDMTFDHHPWYQPAPLFRADMTGEGRRDIVFWVGDRFHVYALKEDGTFASEPREVPSNIEFEIVGLDSVAARLREEDQSDLRLRALYQLADLTGDGTPELVTLTIDSEGVFKKTTTYHVYPGRRDADGRLTFADEPTSTLASRGYQFESDLHDFNADGQMDLIVSSVRIGIGKIVGALLTGSINFDLDFYPMQAGAYQEAPAISRQVTATFDFSSGEVFYPFVLLADLTGDDIAELLVQDGIDTLRIFRGTGEPSFFSRESVDVSLELPNDADLVELADLNGDDRTDLIMRFDNKNQNGGVTLLVTKPESRL